MFMLPVGAWAKRRGAWRWCRTGPVVAGAGACLQPPPIRSRPRPSVFSRMRPDNPIPHALDSVGRPVRTPHLRERRLAYEPAGPGRIRASSPARRPRATHLIASPSASLSSLLQRAIPWFDPRREHSSVPTAIPMAVARRGGQGWREAPPEGLVLDRPEHGGTLAAIGHEGDDVRSEGSLRLVAQPGADHTCIRLDRQGSGP